MFKKSFKLNTSEFNEVFNFGKTIRKEFFTVKIRENKLKHPRFSVVVSKKISKKAHERNYIKRKFFHAIKENVDLFMNNDYIFILNLNIKDLQYKELLQILKN